MVFSKELLEQISPLGRSGFEKFTELRVLYLNGNNLKDVTNLDTLVRLKVCKGTRLEYRDAFNVSSCHLIFACCRTCTCKTIASPR